MILSQIKKMLENRADLDENERRSLINILNIVRKNPNSSAAKEEIINIIESDYKR